MIRHGGLLRAFSFARPIRGSGSPGDKDILWPIFGSVLLVHGPE